jgi:hypothetical protein
MHAAQPGLCGRTLEWLGSCSSCNQLMEPVGAGTVQQGWRGTWCH